MSARNFRPNLEALEDRCTPSVFSFSAALGGGNSAVSLLIDIQYPPQPIAPEIVTVSRLLPNGVIQQVPPNPCTPPNPGDPPLPIHDLFPPGSYRGWLQAAEVSSSVFIVPISAGGGGNGP
jgi:hypothetical protein